MIHPTHQMRAISDVPWACVSCWLCSCHGDEGLKLPCKGFSVPKETETEVTEVEYMAEALPLEELLVAQLEKEDKYLWRAKDLVRRYITEHLEKTDPIPEYDVYVVWFCKTLQHWKALVSTSLPDGMYYEVTHNGSAGETYLDAYKKFKNVCYLD